MSKQTFTSSDRMALERPRGALGKVSTVFATKLKPFTFLPVLKKLPSESRVISAWEKESSSLNKALRDPEVSEGSMADEDVYKAKVVYIEDFEDTEPPETSMYSPNQLRSSVNSALALGAARSDIGGTNPKPSLATTVPIENKHPGFSQLGCHDTFGDDEVKSGLSLNSMSHRDEDVLSPASSVDLFASLASSKESILSDAWEQERSCSGLQMFSPSGSPCSFSRTISPCSSVRSEAFTPSVVRIKRHTLAPGSNLVQMTPPSCWTPGCESLPPSPCPLPSRGRHRPPPTQLSLLTAILRKGRLPVLSPALQRPYSPCWPISPVSKSSCRACSAASTVTPIEGPQEKPCASKNIACKGPSSKPKPAESTYNAPCAPTTEQNKVSISSTPLDPPDTFQSCGSEISRVYSSPEGSKPLTLPTSFSSKRGLSHLSKPVYKDPDRPSVPSSFLFTKGRPLSPKPSHLSCCSPGDQTCTSVSSDHSAVPISKQTKRSLDVPKEEHLEKPNTSTPIIKYTEPDQEPSLALKHEQMTRVPSPTRDLKPTQQPPNIIKPAALKHADDSPHSRLQNGTKVPPDLDRVLSASPAFRLSPSPRLVGLTRLAYTPPISPACPSPKPSSRSATPDRCILSPSPAVSSRQLSPSPSYSLCSSPSPSLWDSTLDCTDRAGKSRKQYKIKSTYKALAAIPTNTLLLEQQAIDDEVEKNEASLDPSDNFAWEDPHSQMCTPAQLRQQSAELYAIFDEVLEDPNQTNQPIPPNKLTAKSGPSETPGKSTPSPRPLGRETKYATFHHSPPSPTERTLTKPGVIKPATITSRLDDEKEREYFLNTFQRYQGRPSNPYQYKFAQSTSPAEDEDEDEEEDEAGRKGASGKQWACVEKVPPGKLGQSASSLALLIDQDRSQGTPPLRDGSLQGVLTSLKPMQVKIETQETHI